MSIFRVLVPVLGLAVLTAVPLCILFGRQRPRANCSLSNAVDIRDEPCTAIDVVIFYELNPNAPRTTELLTALHSLLYYRTCPIRLHFVCGNVHTADTIRSWFNRSVHPNVQLFIHQASNQGFQTAFRESFAASKLFSETILPPWVKKALIMDFDMIWARDACHLFSEQFRHFNESILFSLAVEQSTWHKDRAPYKGFIIDPSVLERFEPRFRNQVGLNSGLILADLDKMRSWNWTERVWNLKRDHDEKFPGETHFKLADQDVFNLLSESNPEIVRVMPPETNWQFCYPCSDGVPKDVYVFHGNGRRFSAKSIEFDSHLGSIARDIIPIFANIEFDPSDHGNRSPILRLFSSGDHARAWCDTSGATTR